MKKIIIILFLSAFAGGSGYSMEISTAKNEILQKKRHKHLKHHRHHKHLKHPRHHLRLPPLPPKPPLPPRP
ncbi:MAG: hypothetical protein ABI760_26325 [Ferruginibacter sp.]